MDELKTRLSDAQRSIAETIEQARAKYQTLITLSVALERLSPDDAAGLADLEQRAKDAGA